MIYGIYTIIMTEKVTIIIEVEQLATLPKSPQVQPNGQLYVGSLHAGRRVKAVIFEDE